VREKRPSFPVEDKRYDHRITESYLKTTMMIKEEIMREAGAKLHLIFSHILPTLIAGTRLSSVDDDVGGLLKYFGARSALKMVGFPGNIAISINNEVIQGVPDSRHIHAGDLVTLDMTLYYKGFFVDKAESVVIDPQHYIKKYLVSAAKKCFEAALANIRPGVTTGQIGSMIATQASFLRVKPCRELCGHYIGESHHMKPLVPNVDDGSQDVVKEGDFLAIEPIVFYNYYVLKHKGFEVTADELSAQVEDTIIDTRDGAEVIT
jgi:methionyl aminopeptidase